MLPAFASSKRLLVALLLLAGVAAAALAAWPSRSGRAGRSAVRTAAAARGDVVVTVGGVGRIVEARAVAPVAVPATALAAAGAPAVPSTPTAASPDSVFPATSGRIVRFLVAPGRHVVAGQVIATLDDGNAAEAAITQARNDAATARLELRQKETTDPAKGAPPTPAEVRAARLALQSAQERARLVAHPLREDTTAARLDIRRAESDLATLARTAGPAALAAARLGVDVAAERLAQAAGPPTPIDVAAAEAELAKAAADLDAVRATPTGPSETAIRAAQLAVTLAQERIAELPPGAPPSDRTSAQLDLAKAQADLEVLQRPVSGQAASVVAAAQKAVDLASQKLAQLTGPPSQLTVASARLDVQRAQAELETLRRPPPSQAAAAARLAVALSHERLRRLLHPGSAARDAARADAAKAAADLETLLRRGAPAGALDIAIARLKMAAADARVRTAELQVGRLNVRAPFAGTVTGLLSVPGAPADPTTPVATVADLRHLAVSVDLSEFDVAKVHAGERAVLSVDALGGRKLSGSVSFVAFGGVESGGVVTFPVRVAFAQSAGVKLGMNVSVRIVVARRRNVVRVPLESVHGGSVTVVDAGGAQTPRHVRLGLADNKVVEVRSGLRAGERVLIASSGG